MAGDSFPIGEIILKIPKGYKVEAQDTKGKLQEDQEHTRWVASDGRMLHVVYFSKFPKEPGAPLRVLSEEPIKVAGEQTKLREVEGLFGSDRKECVVYLSIGEATYIVFEDQISKADFKAILKDIRRSR